MALGGSLPPLSQCLYFPAWCACPWSLASQTPALAPCLGFCWALSLCSGVTWTPWPFPVFFSVLGAGGLHRTREASARLGFDLAGTAGGEKWTFAMSLTEKGSELGLGRGEGG